MEKYFEILTFKTPTQYIGIDCSEIIQTIINKSIINGFIEFDNDEYRFYKIGDIWKSEGEIEYRTLLLIKGSRGKNISLYIPSSLDILKASYEKIIIMPEFIRKRQEPMLNWGFVESEEGLVSLITFNYFK